MMPKLSIFIASMPDRRSQFDILYRHLKDQFDDPNEEIVEIWFDASMEYNIGTKRNKALKIMRGDYIVMVDDDDWVTSDYISKVLTAIESTPDCVGISGTMTTNGQNEQQWHISKDYLRWHEAGGVYYRTPNHISPVRRELALQAGFPEIAHGEDYEYSMRLLPLLKTETKIEGNIYHYQYVTK